MRSVKLSKYDLALGLLPEALKETARSIPESDAYDISELRMRRGRYFTAVVKGKERFIAKNGILSDSCENSQIISGNDIEYVFKTAFRGSVYAFPRELAEGFMTCEGGNRVGFCGSAVSDKQGTVASVRNISSINIRIAREITGCAAELYEMAFSKGLASLIIASPPCGGKTTMLRDMCRILGNKLKVSLIDERGELAALSGGTPQNDVGLHTDVFGGYPKHEAIMTAVRVMSPDIIVCDEIGAPKDYEALRFAMNSGARLVCTCHSPSVSDLKNRPIAKELIKEGAFSYAAILGTGDALGSVTGFYEM